MEFQCSVCTEDMLKTSSEIVSTICGHIYHSSCLLAWLSDHKNCPECRADCNSTKYHKIFLKANEKPTELVNNLLSDLEKKEKQILKLKSYLCENVSEIEKLEYIKSTLQDGLILRDKNIMKLTAELRQYKANKENSVPNKSSRKVAKVAETSTARAVKSSSTRNDISMKPAVKVENEIVVKKVSKPTGTVPKTATGGAIPKISSQKSKEARITLIDRTKMIGELAKLTAKASASCTSSTSSSSSSINSYNSKESRFIH